MADQPVNISAGTQVVSRAEVRGTNNPLGAATFCDARGLMRVEAHGDRLLTVKRGEGSRIAASDFLGNIVRECVEDGRSVTFARSRQMTELEQLSAHEERSEIEEN
jgi:hypothetical protein